MKFGCDDCDNCGLCCKDWDIELSKEDIRSLVNLGYDIGNFLELDPVPRMKMKNAGKEKACIFLDSKNMCVLEKRHGRHAKPHTCRQYPEMKTERIREKDYFFYEYGGKVFTRDVLIRMLDKLMKTSGPYLFEMLLEELELLKKQKTKYVDFFNFDDAKKPSAIGKSFTKRRIKGLLSRKMTEDDRAEFDKTDKSENPEVSELLRNIQKGILTEDALNPNLPEMLLSYFFFLESREPRNPEKAAEYFFKWNGKRF